MRQILVPCFCVPYSLFVIYCHFRVSNTPRFHSYLSEISSLCLSHTVSHSRLTRSSLYFPISPHFLLPSHSRALFLSYFSLMSRSNSLDFFFQLHFFNFFCQTETHTRHEYTRALCQNRRCSDVKLNSLVFKIGK